MNLLNTTIQALNKKRKGEKGVTTVEYAVLIVGISLVVILALPTVTTAIALVFTHLKTALA